MSTAGPAQTLITVEMLRSIISYNADTGVLIWIGEMSRNGKLRPGMTIGSIDRKGYLRVSLAIGPTGARKVRAFAHRVAWALHYGAWPPADKTVDHINNQKRDNRIVNLRLATNQQNCFNSKARRHSRSGLKGVTYNPGAPRRPWVAAICIDGRVTRLGTFSTPEAAHARYVEEAAKLHGEFARAA